MYTQVMQHFLFYKLTKFLISHDFFFLIGLNIDYYMYSKYVKWLKHQFEYEKNTVVFLLVM